jgi:hypothetical protein
VPRLLVGVAEDDELELGARERAPAALARRSSWRRRICRGEATTSLPSAHTTSAMTSTVASFHGVGRSVSKFRLEHEVAVAALPRRHVVALDRVHVDVDGEQVVARLGAVLGHLSRKWRAVSRLPISRPCMSARAMTTVSTSPRPAELAQLVEGHEPASSDSARWIAANSSSGALATRW